MNIDEEEWKQIKSALKVALGFITIIIVTLIIASWILLNKCGC